MRALAAHLQKRSPVVVSSQLTPEERIQALEAFKRSKSQIAIMSMASANSSVTIIEAKAMVFYETSWVYTDYSQATGRIQRPGQNQTTRIYDIRFARSLDNLQLNNIRSKGNTVQQLLSKESLNHDEWVNIFNAISI
jgi:SNF2 family DNA or RNA helicase